MQISILTTVSIAALVFGIAGLVLAMFATIRLFIAGPGNVIGGNHSVYPGSMSGAGSQSVKGARSGSGSLGKGDV